MSRGKRMTVGLIFVSIFLFIIPTFVTAASHTETYELEQREKNHQFIVEGDGEFDVELELPDGTMIDYEEFDQEKYMYFGLAGKRIWVVADAQPGTYTFHITSPEEDDRFSVSEQASVDRPVVTWAEPTNETVSITAGDSLDLSWTVEGEISNESNNMSIYLQPEDSWYLIPVTAATVDRGETSLNVPRDLLTGTYDVIVQVNDSFLSEEIETKLKLDVAGDPDHESMIEVLDHDIENGVLYLTFMTDRNTRFSFVEGQFTGEGDDAGSFQMSTEIDELVLLEEVDELRAYLWPISLESLDPGTYEGELFIRDNDKPMSQTEDVPEFTVLEQVEDNTEITWSIESGKTSELFVEMTVKATEGTIIQVEDEGTMLLNEVMPEGEEEAVFTVPLMEGFRILEVTLRANEQHAVTYAQRYQVDHTPPRLEMIHPLPKLAAMEEAYVSGYVEIGSTVYVNEEEVDVDESGYFRTDSKASDVHVSAVDESGNEAVYSWSPTKQSEESSSSLPLFIGINGGVVAATVGFVWLLIRKRKKPSPESELNE